MRQGPNVLLTCAGRRNYLIGYFREALAGRGLVAATDASADAPALAEAERAFLVPTIEEPGYADTLLDICRENDIGLLLTLNDLELPLLARERERFLREAGTIVVVSSAEVVDTCWDKWKTSEFLRRLGIAAPLTYRSLETAREALRSGELSLPVTVKPRWGTASIGISHSETERELEQAYGYAVGHIGRTPLGGFGEGPDLAVLIQERVQGIEHGLDVVNDLEGRYICTLGRRKLGMRHGETERAITVEDERLSELGRRIGEALGQMFMLDCDVFVDGDEVAVLELNPRFGGGYPFAHAAGANLPAALLAWARGETPDPSWLRVRPNVVSAKCDRVVVVDGTAIQSRLPEVR
jgi:carbamoyl-phosphate synthase large subunit